jgi:hypothetical protein
MMRQFASARVSFCGNRASRPVSRQGIGDVLRTLATNLQNAMGE